MVVICEPNTDFYRDSDFHVWVLESLCLTAEGKQGVFGLKCNVTSELETS